MKSGFPRESSDRTLSGWRTPQQMKITNLRLLVTRLGGILSGFGQIAATRLKTGERSTLPAVTIEVVLRKPVANCKRFNLGDGLILSGGLRSPSRLVPWPQAMKTFPGASFLAQTEESESTRTACALLGGWIDNFVKLHRAIISQLW